MSTSEHHDDAGRGDDAAARHDARQRAVGRCLVWSIGIALAAVVALFIFLQIMTDGHAIVFLIWLMHGMPS